MYGNGGCHFRGDVCGPMPGVGVSGGTERSFYWYDLETSGIDPRWHRVMQFAGIRTDASLDESGDEFTTYIKLPRDVLPDPGACLVTGLTPQHVNRMGLDEIAAFHEVERRFSQPGTCVAGFNSLRFDDEFVRHGFFRSLLDPYAREWQGGNSRWDLLDLARATAALRPDGIEWPQTDRLPVFRLEALAAANGIDHGHAHEALSDVRATIGLARLIRQRQPRLFEYYLRLREKSSALALLRPARPEVCLHVSGMVPRTRQCITPVMPLAFHPHNRNAVVVVDLHGDIEPLLRLDSAQLADLVFSRQRADIEPPMPVGTAGNAPELEVRAADDAQRLRIKEIRVNRCPFVAPMSALRREDRQRLGWNLEQINEKFQRLTRVPGLAQKVAAIYSTRPDLDEPDADASLYSGFVSDSDRLRCREVVAALRGGQRVDDPGFEDVRLTELLFRLRARNREATLDAGEFHRWHGFVRQKLLADGAMPWPTLHQYRAQIGEAEKNTETAAHRRLIADLKAHGADLAQWLDDATPSGPVRPEHPDFPSRSG